MKPIHLDLQTTPQDMEDAARAIFDRLEIRYPNTIIFELGQFNHNDSMTAGQWEVMADERQFVTIDRVFYLHATQSTRWETFAHECCHAAAYTRFGVAAYQVDAGHGPIWKNMMVKLELEPLQYFGHGTLVAMALGNGFSHDDAHQYATNALEDLKRSKSNEPTIYRATVGDIQSNQNYQTELDSHRPSGGRQNINRDSFRTVLGR